MEGRGKLKERDHLEYLRANGRSGKAEGKRPLSRPRRKWKVGIAEEKKPLGRPRSKWKAWRAEGNHLEDLEVNGREMFKWILNN